MAHRNPARLKKSHRLGTRRRRAAARPAWWKPTAAAFLLALLGAPLGAEAPRFAVHGAVTDADGRPVAGTTIEVDGQPGATTDSEGGFELHLDAGPHRLVFRHPEFEIDSHRLTVTAATPLLLVALSPRVTVAEAITITAIRAADEVPVTKHNFERHQLDEISYGQDVPALLQQAPSMSWTSDSGAGSNYSYFTLRGISQTRINITLDGAPLNDPAEHALYFNNFHGFADAVDSIQIQRGVGTSSVGAPSYGGSVNFVSPALADERGFEARMTAGSWNTRGGSVAYQSGRLARGLAFSGRFSYQDTNGYRQGSGSEHHTFFVNGEWRDERSQLKFVSFAGDERSQLAFLAVDPATLGRDRRFNPLAAEERDQFRQRFAQLRYTRELGGNQLLEASLYYNGADGWFRLWDDPATRNELLQFGIDQYFVGSMVSWSRTAGRLATTAGLHSNDFRGHHSLDVVEARLYRNTGFKRETSAFVRASYELGPWLLFGDAQLRWSEFRYAGDIDLGSVDWTFLDPRIGIRRQVSSGLSLYASIGRAEREPTRMDLLAGEDNATVEHDLRAVRPERVVDLEAGVDWKSGGRVVHANIYAMEFDDEIALTGELSEIGLPLRRNIDESYRRGLEIDLRWPLGRRWRLTHSSAWSRNRIREWTQFYDVFDTSGEVLESRPRRHRNVPPLLTPEVVANLGLGWSRGPGELTLTTRYVDDSYLDNTGNGTFRAPAYLNLDLRASLALKRWGSVDRPRIRVYLNNLLDDEKQYPGGYSYLFIQRQADGRESIDGIPFYYPLAARSIHISLELRM